MKALSDADSELTAKRNSRVAQIFQNHELLKKKSGESHYFEEVVTQSNEQINKWFEDKKNKPQIKDIINEFVNAFISDDINAVFNLSEPEILSILEKIAIGVQGNHNPGLGTLNRLYMAVELLHLRKDNWDGARICLIEELEAHLHPQAQLKVIEKLKKEKNVQFILTTHSPNLASQVSLESLIICKNNNAFPMGNHFTKLEKENYKFLQRFLDVTKSNLFFAKGLIIVEGWSEQILIPALAKKLGYDLTKKEVSIINVGSTAYLHFAKIFLRNEDGKGCIKMGVPVSIVTDLDNRPNDDGVFNETLIQKKRRESLEKLKKEFEGSDIILEVAIEWTLEWCLYRSKLSELFKKSVQHVHNGTDEFKYDYDMIGNSVFKSSFEGKFIKKLRKDDGTSSLDKVSIASVLAEKLENNNELIIDQNDDYLRYLINAIKHACSDGDKE